MLRFVWIPVILLTCFVSSMAEASGGFVKVINYYEIILEYLGLSEHEIHRWQPVVGALFTLLVLLGTGLGFKKCIKKNENDVTPLGRFSFVVFVEMILDLVYGLVKDFCGKKYRNFLTIIGAIFAFIMICNLSGLVPGFPPATSSINTNLAMGLMVFLAYNYSGIKEHGVGYIKQFLGPVVWLAPLFLIIELISHSARPFSLSIRLMGNLFGDHLVVAVFSSLTYLVVPGVFLFFGLLVSFVQSFIFTVLSCVYISMAISHDH